MVSPIIQSPSDQKARAPPRRSSSRRAPDRRTPPGRTSSFLSGRGQSSALFNHVLSESSSRPLPPQRVPSFSKPRRSMGYDGISSIGDISSVSNDPLLVSSSSTPHSPSSSPVTLPKSFFHLSKFEKNLLE